MFDKDIVVIGGGSAGYSAAIHASQMGAKVALIEKDVLGGTCLNRGCIPTKSLVRSVELLQKIKKANTFGIVVDNVSVNFENMMANKDRVVKGMVQGVERLTKAYHIKVIRASAKIIGPHEIAVGQDTISTRKIIIATGSEPARLAIPGMELPGVLTTNEILELKAVPKSLVIIGGGYIGIEFAGIFNALGTKVVILEALPQCLGGLEEEMGETLTAILMRENIVIKTEVTIKDITHDKNGLKVRFCTPDGEDSARGDVILSATGRWPYTTGLGLEKLGIKMSKKAIKVNKYLETSVPGVYAIGDALGSHMLAHVAYYEAEIAARNALGDACAPDYGVIPICIFSLPEVASVGMTEKEAEGKHINYNVSKFPFSASGAAMTMNDTTGKVKMICNSDTGMVLGVHIIGAHASDLISEAALGIKMKATVSDIANTIHLHPSLAEVMREVAMEQIHGSIHMVRI